MVSPRLNFSGQDVAYLYPDCRTALVGDFGLDGKMVEARLGEVIGTSASNPSECSCCKELAVIDPRFHISSFLEVTFKCTKKVIISQISNPKYSSQNARKLTREFFLFFLVPNLQI